MEQVSYLDDYDDIYAESKTFDIETFHIDGEGHFFGECVFVICNSLVPSGLVG